MTIDLSKIISAHRFSWTADSLGELLVHNLSLSSHSSLQSRFPNFLDADSIEFSRELAKLVCQRDLDGSKKYTEERLTSEEAKKLTDSELQEFSRLFIDNNEYLKRDHSKKDITRKKDSKGQSVSTVRYETRGDAEKQDDESYTDLLKRLIHDNRLHQESVAKNAFGQFASKHLFSKTALDPMALT